MAALHPLAEVKALAKAGAFELAIGSALNRVIPHLQNGTVAGARMFAMAVIEQLAATDDSETKILDDQTDPKRKRKVAHDEYGTKISTELARAQLDDAIKRTWYVKLTLRRGPTRNLYVLSLHCLERPLRREDRTTLIPCWKE